MKKLLLSILTLTSLSVFAQKDATIKLIAPSVDQEINSGKAFAVGFRVINVGMDTILATDTFRVIPFVYTQAGATPLQALAGAVRIAPGDSVTLASQNPYAVNFTEDIDQALFCVSLNFNDTNLDVNDSNNFDCNEVVLKVNHTGVSEVIAASVKAYPNPANSIFTITMKSSTATVEVMDITGKMIESAAVTMGEARFDVSNYKNGVYFYQIKAEDNSTIKSGKFTVSH